MDALGAKVEARIQRHVDVATQSMKDYAAELRALGDFVRAAITGFRQPDVTVDNDTIIVLWALPRVTTDTRLSSEHQLTLKHNRLTTTISYVYKAYSPSVAHTPAHNETATCVLQRPVLVEDVVRVLRRYL